jgi:hypothetical protein
MPSTLAAESAAQLSLSRRRLLAGISAVSFSALLLELGLTRLFSVVLFYHFAFLAISVALLGLGAGGVFAYLRKSWLERWSLSTLAARICIANAFAILLTLEVVLHVPVALNVSPLNLGKLAVIYIFAAVPFFFTGLLFSIVFARESPRITQLYGADLVGGALACLAIVPLLNLIGGPNALLFASFVLTLASTAWALDRKRQRIGYILAAAFAFLIAANYSGKLVDIVYAKGVRRDKAWVEYSRWNAISRVEVDDQGGGSKAIVIDADANTYIMNAEPKNWRPDQRENLMSAAPAVANSVRPNAHFAIIGPGGGVDVLRAVGTGSRVTGIEINPIIVNNIMRGRYADFAHHLYEIPEVDIHVSDGRSFVRNSPGGYDALQMTLVDTWASTAAGAFALSENNLYTTNAFREYFDHLKPDGMLAITRWEFKSPREALRVVSQAITVLQQLGVRETSNYFIIVSDGALNTDGRPVLVLAKKSPFTPEEEQRVFAHLQQYPNLKLVYSPSRRAEQAGVHPVDPTVRWNPFTAMIISNDPAAFSQKYAYDVTPVDDNAPFFFFTMKLGQVWRNVLSPGESGSGIDWKVNMGVVVLGMVLLISALAVVAFLILPLALYVPARSQSATHLLYFVAVGLGYILVEICLIQKFVLFLGHPTYALTVVVFLMLLASGLGSMVSRRVIQNPVQVWRPLLMIIFAITLYAILLPLVLERLIGMPLYGKLAISAMVLFPLGFIMGMPFPTGMRALSVGATAIEVEEVSARTGQEGCIEWAWAMNAASSVLGSVLAMVIAIQWGLMAALIAGAIAYACATVLTFSFRIRRAA